MKFTLSKDRKNIPLIKVGINTNASGEPNKMHLLIFQSSNDFYFIENNKMILNGIHNAIYSIMLKHKKLYILNNNGKILKTAKKLQIKAIDDSINSFVFDKFNNSLKIIIVFFTFFIFTYSQRYIVNNNIKEGDYYSLCLFSLLGMFLLVSSGNLLVFYLSIELMSLPLYTLIAMIMGYSTSQESAFKYFILGSVASR
jgi:NADH:ubiquinone oxidoreductase subunit 2 (subunit N)